MLALLLACLVVCVLGAPVVPLLVTVSPKASVSEQAAAQWLSSYLSKITSQPCPVLDPASAKGKPQLAVGYDAAIMLGVSSGALSSLGMEGFVVQAGVGAIPAGSVALSGGDQAPRGALYAVNEFLESIGVRFVAQDTTVVPSQESVPLSTYNVSTIPPLEYREVFQWQQQYDQNWTMHRRLNHVLAGEQLDPAHGSQVVYATPPGFVHTSYALLGGTDRPPADLFKQHPDWFWPHNDPNAYGQLCWTNAALVQYLIQQVRQFLKQQPNATIISVSQNDNGNYCKDPAEMAVIQEEGSPMGPLLRAVNAIAAAIASDFPQVAVDTLAYQYTRPATKVTKPLPNVIIRLCSIECNFAAPFTDPSNAPFQQDIVNWNAISHRLYVWDYITDFACYMCPFPDWYTIGPNVQFLLSHGGKGIFEEGTYGGPGGDMSELKDYVLSRMLFDPQQNPDLVIQSFLIYYYGPAALSMMNYMDVMRDSALDHGVYMGEAFPVNAAFLTADAVLRGAQAFADALASVSPDSLYAEHVRRSSMSIYYVSLFRWSELQEYASTHGVPWPLDKDLATAFNTFSANYNETAKRYGQAPIFREGAGSEGLEWLAEQIFPPDPYCPDKLTPTVIHPISVAVSSSSSPPTLDGYWISAGYVPQWIEFTLPAGSNVGGMAARINQTPDGATSHTVFFDGVQVAVSSGMTKMGQVLQWGPTQQPVGKVRIQTNTSPSWVAWAGIVFAHCT